MRKIGGLLLVLILSSFLFPVTAFADESVSLAGKDEEGSYIYSFKDYGTFKSNLSEGETAEVGFIEYDDSLTVSVMKDGKPYEIEDGIFYENGNYVVFIYAGENNEYATFSFSIENNIFAGAGEDNSENKKEKEAEKEETVDLNSISVDDMDLGVEGFGENFDIESFGDISSLLRNYGESDNKQEKFDFGYSTELNEIVYSYNGTEYFSSDVPNRALVTGEVHVATVNPDFSYYYYYNDEIDFASEDAVYTEPGKYDFVVYVNLPEGGMGELHFGFTIMGEVTKDLSVVTAPEGFYIKKLTRDGFAIEASEEKAEIDVDGFYQAVFASRENRGLSYNLSFRKDTVPPTLTFSEDIYAKKVKAPIRYTIDEEGATVKAKMGGYAINIPEDTDINTRGQYSFIVTDEAGNVTEYYFYLTASYKFGVQGWIFVGVFVLVVGVYLVLVRIGSKYGV